MKMALPLPREATSPQSYDLSAELTDLGRATLRDITLAVAGTYLLWHFIGAMTWPTILATRLWLSMAILAPLFGLTYLLIPRHLNLARVGLLISLAVGISLNLFLFRQQGVSYLLVLLPLLAVTIAGWQYGLLVELVVTLLVLFPLRGLLEPGGLSLPVAIILGGAFTGLVGYTTSRTLLVVTERSLISYAQARQNMEEAREHRGKLVMALKDLDLAYYRLERANSALMIASKVAEEAERFKTEFVTTVSHELRTPLNLIIGFIEVIMTSPESYGGVELPAVYRSDLNAIYHSSRHVMALVDDVIDMARLDAGRFGMTYANIPLQVVINDAIEMVRDYIHTKGLTLNVHLAEKLPNLWIDRLRIRQVLLNLLINATRFTSHGSITLIAEREENNVLIKVIDTGQGIHPQDIPQVFEEFHPGGQAETTWHSGSGLGLPISKKIIEAHGGQMGVESVYGEGSNFWLVLPVRSETDVKELDNKKKPAYIYRPAQLADPLVPVLVTTYSDPHTQELLQRQMNDYQVYKTASLDEALALAEQHQALAVVTEQPLLALPAESKCLFIHCLLPSGRNTAEALGAQDILVKPVTTELLWSTIERLKFKPQSVLVVDDDVNITRLFRRMLRLHIPSDRIYEAHNGDEALASMHEYHPTLVLLDLDIPGTDGLAVLAQKNRSPDLTAIQVIVITGHDEKLVGYDVYDKIEVARPIGFRPGQAIQAVDALIKSLSPQMDWSGSSGPMLRVRSSGRPAWGDTPPLPGSKPA